MTFTSSLRKLHRWSTVFVAAPLLVTVCTGILLQVKKHWDFVQPPEHRGQGTSPNIDLVAILAAARRAPEARVSDWDDIRRVDLRPDRGLAKVWTHSGHEVQVDLADGEILHVAVRRSDFIESLHDGSFFGGDAVKLGIFLPCGAVLLFMWFSGVWLFAQPLVARRRSRRPVAAE